MFTHLTQLSDADLAIWKSEARESAPSQASAWLTGALSTGALGHRVAAAAGLPWSLHVAIQPSALREDFTNLASGEIGGLRLLTCLHDQEESEDEGVLRRTWALMLRTMNLLRLLPRAWFIARRDQDAHDYDTLALLHAMASPSEPSDWAQVGEQMLDEGRALFGRMREAGVPIPEVGVDLADDQGHTSGVTAELLWTDHKVAVVFAADLEATQEVLPAGWAVHTIEGLLNDFAPLIQSFDHQPDGGVP